MKQEVRTSWAKTTYALSDEMQSLVKDGWVIVSFQVLQNTLGYEAIVVLQKKDTADEG